LIKQRLNLCQYSKKLAIFFALSLLIGLSACVQPTNLMPLSQKHEVKANRTPPELRLVRVKFSQVPGWKADNHSLALPAFLRSCTKLVGQSPKKALGNSSLMGTISDWLSICQDAERVRPGNSVDAQYFFESRFKAYMAISPQGGKGKFTGYYEPELRGAWKPTVRFRVPIYARPKDIIGANLGKFDDALKESKIVGRIAKGEFVPYYNRAEIETGALNGRQLEILWVDDPVDAFFMHIQGSGRIQLPDGAHIRLGYDGRNGRPYTAVGRELVGAGVMRLKDVTMPAIRAWMIENPIAAQSLMWKNRSFIFFKVLKGSGPVGAQGVELVPGRSLAVDKKFVPLGIPIWLDTTDPGTKPLKVLRRLVIAQDTGSAIKGPIRGDFFWGFGAQAGQKAGIMNQVGRYYLLLPRTLELKDTIN
tara:strand:+ start:1479 stop:2735 length:1257 start_codon:yes stop_codon:yes gene_type:complete